MMESQVGFDRLRCIRCRPANGGSKLDNTTDFDLAPFDGFRSTSKMPAAVTLFPKRDDEVVTRLLISKSNPTVCLMRRLPKNV